MFQRFGMFFPSIRDEVMYRGSMIEKGIRQFEIVKQNPRDTADKTEQLRIRLYAASVLAEKGEEWKSVLVMTKHQREESDLGGFISLMLGEDIQEMQGPFKPIFESLSRIRGRMSNDLFIKVVWIILGFPVTLSDPSRYSAELDGLAIQAINTASIPYIPRQNIHSKLKQLCKI